MTLVFGRPPAIEQRSPEIIEQIAPLRPSRIQFEHELVMLDWLEVDLTNALSCRGTTFKHKVFAVLPALASVKERKLILRKEMPGACHLSKVELSSTHPEAMLRGLFADVKEAFKHTRFTLSGYKSFQSIHNQRLICATFAVNVFVA